MERKALENVGWALVGSLGLGLPLGFLIAVPFGRLQPPALFFGFCAFVAAGLGTFHLSSRFPRARRRLRIVILAAAILGWTGIGHAYWQTRVFTFQIRNLQHMHWTLAAVNEHFAAEGQYPETLGALHDPELGNGRSVRSDYWGHPWIYQRRGDAFLLISAGKDHRLDRPSYWPLYDSVSDTGVIERACGSVDLDLVGSDLGILKGCGK